MAEAIQLVSFLFSGADISGSVSMQLTEKCTANGPGDVYGRPKFPRPCVRDVLGEVLLSESLNTPGWLKYFAKLGKADRIRYTDELLDTAFDVPYSSEDWVERSEISTLSVILQYTEAMMTRYDSDDDGLLSTDEIEAAVPVFSGFIQKIAREKLGKELSAKMARAALYFIITRKKLPETKFEQIQVLKIKYFGAPAVSMDRLELLQVFHAIVEYIVHTGTPQTPDQTNSH
jgi:hypothetical protein